MSETWREGNSVELLINGEEYFPRVFNSIRAARREVIIETFILYDDEVGWLMTPGSPWAQAASIR